MGRKETSSTYSEQSSNPQISSVWLTRKDLVARWRCSSAFVRGLNSLEYYRFQGRGKALYKLEDVERFERENFQKWNFRNFSDERAA